MQYRAPSSFTQKHISWMNSGKSQNIRNKLGLLNELIGRQKKANLDDKLLCTFENEDPSTTANSFNDAFLSAIRELKKQTLVSTIPYQGTKKSILLHFLLLMTESCGTLLGSYQTADHWGTIGLDCVIYETITPNL